MTSKAPLASDPEFSPFTKPGPYYWLPSAHSKVTDASFVGE